jgi:hypothetical protein
MNRNAICGHSALQPALIKAIINYKFSQNHMANGRISESYNLVVLVLDRVSRIHAGALYSGMAAIFINPSLLSFPVSNLVWILCESARCRSSLA